MGNSRRTGEKRATGFSFRPAASQIDQLQAATRCAESSWLNAPEITRNFEMLFKQMYRRHRAGLPPHHLTVERLAPAPLAASSEELYS